MRERPFPKACHPGWDYESYEGHDVVLPQRARDFLIALRSDSAAHQHPLQDIRPTHGGMFAGLTPADREYYAGNYRGEDFFCLFGYPVGVPADGLVGCLPEHVQPWMNYFTSNLEKTLAELDRLIATRRPASTIELLSLLVPIAAEVLDLFLKIHPFANGNGHMARALIFTFFSRYQVWPQAWTLDSSPPYSPAIYEHRRGNVDPLQAHLYMAILGPGTHAI